MASKKEYFNKVKKALEELHAAIDATFDKWNDGVDENGQKVLIANIDKYFAAVDGPAEGIYESKEEVPGGMRMLSEAYSDAHMNYVENVLSKPSPSGFTALVTSTTAQPFVMQYHIAVDNLQKGFDKECKRLCPSGIMKYALPIGLTAGAIILATQMGK
jgi:hypothetical protein